MSYPRNLRAGLGVLALSCGLLRAVADEAKPAQPAALASDVEMQLRVLAGHPDLKPGIAATKVAAWAWNLRHVIEEYDANHLRVNFALEDGRVLLAYGAEYAFAEGRLLSCDIQPREHPPALEAISRLDRDAMPWIAIDRTLLGYAFRVPATWRLVAEKDFPGEEFSLRFTVIALPKIYDSELKAWIENSLQWCVFRRDKPFAEIDEVMVVEEQRLEQMGTEIVRRGDTEDASGFLYETVYQGNTYQGKTYFMVADDGAGFSLRFNATPGTFSANLPRFERFAKGFIVTRERIRDPDLELVRDGDAIRTIVGGSIAAREPPARMGGAAR